MCEAAGSDHLLFSSMVHEDKTTSWKKSKNNRKKSWSLLIYRVITNQVLLQWVAEVTLILGK